MFRLSDYTSVFFDAEVVPPLAWAGLIPFGNFIVELARPRTFVELGTHAGNSFINMVSAAQRLGLDMQCHAIDTWQGDAHAGYYDDSVYATLSRYVAQHFGDMAQLHRCSFDQALNAFADGSIDLLHIDGLHTYQAVRHDFETWAPKLSPRAIVLLHDTAVTDGEFGVHRLFDELKNRYSTFSLDHSNGLGCVFVGAEQTPTVSGFIAHAEQYPASVRAYFKAAGDAVVRRAHKQVTPERESHVARVYYAAAGSRFSESEASRREVTMGPEVHCVEFPVSCNASSRLRIDPAETPGIYTLDAVQVRSGGVWQDLGDLRAALSNVSGILLDSTGGSIKLLCLDNDPNFELSLLLADVRMGAGRIDCARITWRATPFVPGTQTGALLEAITANPFRVMPNAADAFCGDTFKRKLITVLERQSAALERLIAGNGESKPDLAG